jgi:hypothetical protein
MHAVGCVWPGIIVQQYDVSLQQPISTSQWWSSAGGVPFSRRNLITLCTLMFDHVSSSPAILQLMGQYDWYEAWYSIHGRKQCSACSDLAANLNEIRNITHVRGLVTLFIESPLYKVRVLSSETYYESILLKVSVLYKLSPSSCSFGHIMLHAFMPCLEASLKNVLWRPFQQL